MVHELLSLQLMVAPELQVPPPQMSGAVHAFPSLQEIVFGALEQRPLAGLQVSVVQTLLSLQFFCGPGVHAPAAVQVSEPVVQAFPSLHVVVASRFRLMHVVAAAPLQRLNLQSWLPRP
jgi:hypothetical protein